MLRDAWLVALKEYREVLLRMGSLRANLLNLGLILFVFGVFMPLQAGEYWVSRWWMLPVWVWLPLFLVSALVADSFAGERERHTLETLLASRLSDRAILLGKLAAAVLYGYGMLLIVMVVSLITVNAKYGSWRHPMLFPTEVTLGVVVYGLLVTLLIASVGVMVSLKAKTVRQAGQALSLGLVALMWIPGLIIGYAYRMLPAATQKAVVEWLAVLDGRLVAVAIAVILALVDAAFLTVAARRFRRARLILD